MRPGRQKAKGYSHEMAIGRIFTEAYYPDNDGIFLRRDSLPGIRDKKLVPGDLVAMKYLSKDEEELSIDKTFPLVLECKHYSNQTLKHFFSGLYSNESQIWDWIEQVWDDSLHVKKIPIVIFRLFRTEDVVEILSTDFHQLSNYFGNFPGRFYKLKRVREAGFKVDKKAYLKHSSERGLVFGHDCLYFFLLKDFLKWIDWSMFKTGGKFEHIRSLMEHVKEQNVI